MANASKESLFSVVWLIEDLQHQPFKEGDCVPSEPFTIPGMGFTRWRIEYLAHGNNFFRPNTFSFQLRRLPSENVHYEYSHKDEIFVSVKFGVYAKIRKTYEEIEYEMNKKEDMIRRQMYEEKKSAKLPCFGDLAYKRKLRNKKFGIFEAHRNDITIPGIDKHFGSVGFAFQINCEFFHNFPHNFPHPPHFSKGVGDYMLFSNDLKELFSSQHHFDLVLSCQGRLFKVHRCVIACRARQLLQLWGLNAMPRDEIITVNVPNISYKVLQTILVFIYTGAADIRPSQVTQELVEAAGQYRLEDLLRNANPYPKIIRMWSRFNLEKKTVHFGPLRYGKVPPASQVIRLNTLYCDYLRVDCNLLVSFKQRRRSQIAFKSHFIGFNNDLPIEVSGFFECTKEERSLFVVKEIEDFHYSTTPYARMGEHEQKFDISVENWRTSNLSVTLDFFMTDGETRAPPQISSIANDDTCTSDFFKLIDDFSRLFDEQLYTDFTIICNSEEFNVHKCILVARSEYFRASLAHGTTEWQNGFTRIDNIRPESMRIFLIYIYKGSLPSMTYEAVIDLYREADKCPMETLKSKCREELMKNMDETNYENAELLAETFLDGLLKEFINRRFGGDGCTLKDDEDWTVGDDDDWMVEEEEESTGWC